MTAATDFYAAMMREPLESLHCAACADWMAERGREAEERCFRWMARTGCRPFFRERYAGGQSVPAAYSWGWYRRPIVWQGDKVEAILRRLDPTPPLTAVLPRTVFAAISSAHHKYYPSWAEAVADLAAALARTREDCGA